MKHWNIFLLCTVCIFWLTMPVLAHPARLIDDADLLSDVEEARVTEALDALSVSYDCDVVVVTTDSLDGYGVQAYADDYFDYNGYGMGDDASGILFLVSMAEREWALSTVGDAVRIFTDAGLAQIEDAVITHLSLGDYADAFLVYAATCESLFQYAESGTPYDVYYDDYGYRVDYERPVSTPPGLGWVIGSAIVGFVLALIVVSCMKGELTSVRRQAGASAYETPGSFRVTLERDRFLYRNVTRVRRQTEQTRSGGSSVHRSSSGRSHGGRSGRF